MTHTLLLRRTSNKHTINLNHLIDQGLQYCCNLPILQITSYYMYRYLVNVTEILLFMWAGADL